MYMLMAGKQKILESENYFKSNSRAEEN